MPGIKYISTSEKIPASDQRNTVLSNNYKRTPALEQKPDKKQKRKKCTNYDTLDELTEVYNYIKNLGVSCPAILRKPMDYIREK